MDVVDRISPTQTAVCPNHKPVQHSDSNPPWCNRCGKK